MVYLDGYSSTSKNEKLARYFAFKGECGPDFVRVLLKIEMENESGKYYFYLDSSDYTCYPDEKEILLQSGLKFKLKSVEYEKEKDLIIVSLYTSERVVS